MSNLVGRKISSSHTSNIEVAESVIRSVGKLECVSKIVLGIIKSIKSPPVGKSIKVSDVPAGIRVKVRGPKSVQELFIYTSDRAKTTDAVIHAFRT